MNNPVILVVEDNAVLQRIIKLMLGRFGIDAELASNGNDALVAVFSGRPFAAVLMDWRMPFMDGLECTRHIRQREHQDGGHVTIIGMTANAAAQDRQICLDSGMDDYISKPFENDRFCEVVERWVWMPESQQVAMDGIAART